MDPLRFTVNQHPQSIDPGSDELDGNLLTFSFIAGPMGQISGEVTITEDTMEGTVSGSDFGGLGFTGTRTSGPGF